MDLEDSVLEVEPASIAAFAVCLSVSIINSGSANVSNRVDATLVGTGLNAPQSDLRRFT